jgi:uncharacterized protein YcfL
MKKTYLLLACVLLFTACKPKPTTEVASVSPDYPYKIKNPDNWLIDTSHTNTMVALNALKSYETMDTVLMKKCFADSLTFKYDGGTFKGSIGQLIQMVGSMGTTMKNVKLDVKDWESVVSKDKKEEWVTIWYTQHWTDEKGKADSVEYINDMALKGGKIFKFDEYARHFKMPGK